MTKTANIQNNVIQSTGSTHSLTINLVKGQKKCDSWFYAPEHHVLNVKTKGPLIYLQGV